MTEQHWALILGASSGFGRDAAQTLAHAGHRVFASMRDIADRNGPHAEALRARAARGRGEAAGEDEEEEEEPAGLVPYQGWVVPESAGA